MPAFGLWRPGSRVNTMACSSRPAEAEGPRHTPADALEVLRDSRWFNQLPGDALETLAACAQFLSLPRGALFIRKGDYAPGVGILLNGTVCASTVSLEGHEFTLSMLEFDGIIGLAAVLDGKAAMRDSRVHADAEILLIPRDHFLRTFDRHPCLYRYFTIALCDRIRTANRIIDELALRSLRQRLARLLWTLANPRRDAAAVLPCQIVQTQDELAHLLGVSRHAVNRELKRMERVGEISIGYGYISVLDGDLLARAAESG